MYALCKSESAITDPESAEIVCTKCGIVISDKIEQTQHTLESKNTKGTGMPLARHDGLYTSIGRTDKDASGRKIKPYVRSTMPIRYYES